MIARSSAKESLQSTGLGLALVNSSEEERGSGDKELTPSEDPCAETSDNATGADAKFSIGMPNRSVSPDVGVGVRGASSSLLLAPTLTLTLILTLNKP